MELLAEHTLPFGGMLASSIPGESLGLRYLVASAGMDPPGYTRHHFHDVWVLVATMSGRVELETSSVHVFLEPGDVFLIPPELPFCETQHGETPWTWLCAMATPSDDRSFLTLLPHRPLVFHATSSFYVHFADMLLLLDRKENGDRLAALGLSLTLFGECFRHATLLHAGSGSEGRSVFLIEATTYMRAHLRDVPSLAGLASHCRMSISSVSHRFKQETGLSPMHWHERERMALARHILLEGRSVTETSYDLGFASPFHFSRAFKRMEGVPPSRFQRLARLRE